ncbi:hypothetical protein D3C72_1738140 [compost metagenome]
MGLHGEDADDPSFVIQTFGQYFDDGGMIVKRDIQTDRFIRKHLDHQPRCPRTATGRAADFVVVGLISQRPTQRVLRQGQSEELQRGHHARGADRLDIGGILIHGAAAADGARHCLEVVALIGRVRGVERLFV